eukprot:2816308-Pleurochrysis_carterae.AAC.1
MTPLAASFNVSLSLASRGRSCTTTSVPPARAISSRVSSASAVLQSESTYRSPSITLSEVKSCVRVRVGSRPLSFSTFETVCLSEYSTASGKDGGQPCIQWLYPP